jgi:hypothetical protein
MPQSRGRKPKSAAKIVSTKPGAKSLTAEPSRIKRLLGALAATATFILGALVLLPQVTIEATSSPQPPNPFSGVFKIENGQIYPIEDVRIEAYMWCVKMGTGTDTTPPPFCNKGNLASSKKEWNNRTIDAHDAYEITVGDVLFGTPNGLLYADISIRVTYKAWFIPIHFEREQRFYTRRKDDGGVEWLHKPLA